GAVEVGPFAFISGGPADLVHDVARVARAQVLLHFVLDEARQQIRNVLLILHLQFRGDTSENLRELILVNGPHPDLRLNSAQEGRIDEFTGLLVGGKNHQHFERHFDLLAAGKIQEIDMALERDDPAVHQFFGAYALASEVVDDQHAVVRFHLERPLVKLGHRVVLQVEHLARKFTANHHGGAFAAHPARIMLGEGALNSVLLVNGAVKDGHELPLDFDCIGYPDRIASHDAGEDFGNGGFTRSRGAIEEQGAAGVKRG